MLKKLMFSVGFLAVASTASAGPLLLAVTGGGWTNPAGPAGTCVDIDNRGGTMQDEIRWNGEDLLPFAAGPHSLQGDACGLAPAGQTPYMTGVSGYNFDPNGGLMAFMPGTTTIFSLGTFQHLNNPISDAITSVDYQMSIFHNDFNAPPTNPLELTLSFQHNETDNVFPAGASPTSCCADIVQMLIPVSTTTFTIGNHTYLLQLLGFSLLGRSRAAFSNQFSSPEGGTNQTRLWAQVSHTPVPEPATMTLLGTGVLGLAAARRRRKKAQAQQPTV